MPMPPSHVGVPLLERVRRRVRARHYSIRTEEAYFHAVRRFILFHGKRHPMEMGAEEIRQYLSHLANDKAVAASTRNQALSALLFLYREVLGVDLPFIEGISLRETPRPHPGRPDAAGGQRPPLSPVGRP